MIPPIQALQKWYLTQCNGDWEHTYGIEITTLDDPGWRLRIDLDDTDLENKPHARLWVRRNRIDDWLICWVESKKFTALCGPLNLEAAVLEFVQWAGNAEPVAPEPFVKRSVLQPSLKIVGSGGPVAQQFFALAQGPSDHAISADQTDELAQYVCSQLSSLMLVGSGNLDRFVQALFALDRSLDPSQRAKIVDSIVVAYSKFTDVPSCTAMADYVVQCETMDNAVRALDRMSRDAETDEQVYGVLDATERLWKRAHDYVDVRKNCLTIMQGLRDVRIVEEK